MARNDARIERTYRNEHARLWRSLLAFTGDPEVAADAEAEAFTQLLARGDAVRDPAAWVWRSAFRIAGGMLAGPSADSLACPGPLDGPVVGDDPPLIDLLSMLGALSDQQRACVILRYVGRFTGPEIADRLGTSPGTVRVQLHRAHRILQRSMEAS